MKNTRQNIIYTIVVIVILILISVFTGQNILSLEEVEDQKEVEELTEIYVHICGEVVNPGTYKVKSDSRILDAVDAAGGVTEEADINKNNYAKKIIDGEKIIILGKGDNIEDFPELQGKLNINTATISELKSLDGIGDVIAGRIVDYRYEFGLFSNVNDLLNIEGIGESKLNSIVEQICIY